MKKLKLLVLKEKYGDWYFDASTDKQLYDASLLILKNRYESFIKEELEELIDDYSDLKNPLEDFDYDINKIKNESVKKSVIQLYDTFIKNKGRKNNLIDEKERIENCLNSKNGKYAYKYLLSRSTYEYEQIDLIETADPKEYIA